METMNQATVQEEDPRHGVIRKVFWIGFYFMLLLPLIRVAIYNPFFDFPWLYASPIELIMTLVYAGGLLLVPMAIWGAYTGVFIDTSNQRSLFFFGVAFVTLSSLFLALTWLYSTQAMAKMFEVEAPSHIWDLKTLFVYSYRSLYLAFLIGATALVLRLPGWAALLLTLGLVLRTFEKFYSMFVDHYVFVATHHVILDKYVMDQIAAAPPPEIFVDGELVRVETVRSMDFNMFYTFEFLPFALAIALATMARKKGLAKERAKEG